MCFPKVPICPAFFLPLRQSGRKSSSRFAVCERVVFKKRRGRVVADFDAHSKRRGGRGGLAYVSSFPTGATGDCGLLEYYGSSSLAAREIPARKCRSPTRLSTPSPRLSSRPLSLPKAKRTCTSFSGVDHHNGWWVVTGVQGMQR